MLRKCRRAGPREGRETGDPSTAFHAIHSIYENSVRKGRFSSDEMQSRLSRIRLQLDHQGFGEADIVVEAAFENIEVKKAVFRELGPLTKATATLATNTSYLNVDHIAAACARPESVIGLHFFSPANVMRLIEVVPGTRTSRTVTAAAFEAAKKLGKIPVLAGNSPGFIGNRMLRAYRREAQLLLEEGVSPRQVDSTLEQ